MSAVYYNTHEIKEIAVEFHINDIVLVNFDLIEGFFWRLPK